MKARNAKSLSARCAGACPFASVSTRARSAAGGECGKGSRLSAETREEKHKTRLNSRKSPQVFAGRSFCRRKAVFFCLKLRLFEMYRLSLRLIKHNLPFFLPPGGVHIARIHGLFLRVETQMLFDLLNDFWFIRHLE